MFKQQKIDPYHLIRKDCLEFSREIQVKLSYDTDHYPNKFPETLSINDPASNQNTFKYQVTQTH